MFILLSHTLLRRFWDCTILRITLCVCCALIGLEPASAQDVNDSNDVFFPSAEKISNPQQRAEALLRLAWEKRATNPVESIVAAQKALTIAKKIQQDSLIGTAHRFMSVAYRNTSEYAKAAENAFSALRSDEKRKDSLSIGHSLNTIAGILRFQKDIVKSEEYARKALAIAERLKDKRLQAYAHLNIAEAQHEIGLYGTAIISAEKALAIWEELKQYNYIAVVKSVIGKELISMGKVQEGERLIEQALSIFEEHQQYHDVALTLNRLARFKYEKNALQEAEMHALRAYLLAQNIHSQFHEQEAANILALCYEKEGKFREALQFNKKHQQIHDSIFAESATRNVQLLQIEYDTRAKEQQIDLLRDQQQLSLFSRSILIAGILVVLLIAALLYVRYRQSSDEIRVTSSRAERLADLNDDLRLAHIEAEEQNRHLRLAQLEIQDQNLRLADLNNEKNMILGMVSHDLKNPIVALQGLSEMMLSEKLTDDQNQEFAQIINETSNRMFTLVRTFLDFARMEDGRMRLQPIEFDLNSVVSMMVEDYRRRAEAKSITLHFSPHFEPLLVFADEIAAKQVLDNIISNAVKYTPQGKNVAVRILPIQTLPQGMVLMREDIANLDDLEFEAKTTHIRVEIMDEGPGFTEEDKSKLFGKFARLSAQPTGGESSTGLGLAIAKKLIELMNGRIWCDSEYGEGAVFCVELPCPVVSNV